MIPQGYGDAHPRKQCDTDDADRAPVFRAFFVAKTGTDARSRHTATRDANAP